LDELVGLVYLDHLMTSPNERNAFDEAVSLHKQGRLPEAIVAYQRSLASRPELWTAAANMGKALADLERFAEAVAAYQHALRYSPTEPRLHIGLTLALIGQGNCVAPDPPNEQSKIIPHLPSVTLCCVDTNHPEGGVFSMRQSMAQAKFANVILFTSRSIATPGIDVRVIPAFTSVEDYSRFMFSKTLIDAIQTSHLLLTHWDGWVLDGARWRDEFLASDYIGPPWPWYASKSVGNGGFCLRSRRLLETVAQINPPRLHPEDEVISRDLREPLESRGLRFADEQTAWTFAQEWRGENRPAPFGFHGLFNLRRFLSRDKIEAVLNELPTSLTNEKQSAWLRGG
jgi:hypothetical protein